ncbi:ABC transporter ATP-binding protein [Mobiluncus mulieris]|uniref:ATP-binding cassette domain-containing protein n=1 Tax=Mobiluncus mulieris TaxID=2052 RepID=A0ABD4TUM9_9ACTO|nr:ATP-binding cassette domain-containing protein [Mobiluncus mulieris]MCU9968615.1 ATP-binding cassette domain-containing protein [Mobiluncus mulieris]MCU9972850.1 ATP-binding cassette domain-containing protein [Mobiluncus mulieris]MCV0009862.1 ATP-binding cassette domain-containing protein [Mobiluncus mulieris]NMW60563.1 ATP-binding cassette domain-containing protein [Mobiluncus mulieris]NMW74950.1 ATP-binding cassette domain-containing protein [Mobiluncus mulieris]
MSCQPENTHSPKTTRDAEVSGKKPTVKIPVDSPTLNSANVASGGEARQQPGGGTLTPEILVRGLNFAYATASNGDVFETAAQRRARRAGKVPETSTIPALVDISLECPPGSLTLLCGASGCGKSTLLRALNGLVPFFHRGTLRGKVTVGGLSVPDAPLALLGDTSATVFQNPRTQFFTADVTSELAFRGENAGEPPAQIWQDILGACKQLDTAKFLGRALGALSGGELQKIACTAALASGKRILFFDEPTSNLSPGSISEFAKILANLKSQGYTTVVAEHRLYFLNGLADRVVVLDHGKIAADYDGQEFFALSERARQNLGLRTLTELGADSSSVQLVPDFLPPAPAMKTVPRVHEPKPSHNDTNPNTNPGTAPAKLTTILPGSRLKNSAPTAHKAPPDNPDIQGPIPSPDVNGPSSRGLHLENLRFSYGNHQILDIPDFTFPAGKVNVLVGQNGVGKTTLSRVICGLAKASGQISLNGKPLSRRERQRLAYIVMQDVHRQLFADSVLAEVTLGQKPYRQAPQIPTKSTGSNPFHLEHRLFPAGGTKTRNTPNGNTTRLSGTEENLPVSKTDVYPTQATNSQPEENPANNSASTPQKPKPGSKNSRMAPSPERVREILHDLDLWNLRERHPLSLSGGQKQRLVIASALAWRKQVYIFDEPTSGVDYRHLLQIADQLRTLADTGAVVIVVTHDFELLEHAADTVIRLAPHEPDTKSAAAPPDLKIIT